MNYPQQPGNQPDPYRQYGGQQQPYGAGQAPGRRPGPQDYPQPGHLQPGHPQGGYQRPEHQQGGYSRSEHEQNDRYQEPPATRRRRPEPTPKRRRVWPWVLLGVFLVPILGFAACTALLAGGVSAVDQQRAGGTVAIGDSFTYQSGLGLAVTAPVPYDAGNEFIIGPDEQGYEVSVTITNGTDRPVGAVLVTTNATVNSTPATQVFDESFLPTQDIAPGQQLVVPFRFKVPAGTTGPLQIAVTDTFNEPVFFTGQLG